MSFMKGQMLLVIWHKNTNLTEICNHVNMVLFAHFKDALFVLASSNKILRTSQILLLDSTTHGSFYELGHDYFKVLLKYSNIYFPKWKEFFFAVLQDI